MTQYSHAYEKFLGATEIMATGKGSRQERLERAVHHVRRIENSPASPLPDEIRQTFKAFMEETRSSTPEWDGDNAYSSTFRAMHWKKTERLSQSLFQMFLCLSRHHFSSPRN